MSGEDPGVGIGSAREKAWNGEHEKATVIALLKFLSLLASPTAVGTIPIAGTGMKVTGGPFAVTGPLTDAQLAARLPFGVTGPYTDAQARALATTLWVTFTAAVNVGATLTLPAPGAGLFHYITFLELVKLYSVIGVAAGAGVLVTSTNMPGNPIFTTEQLASPAGTAAKVISLAPAIPLKSSVANTATTFVAPQQLQTIWRWNVAYYTGP